MKKELVDGEGNVFFKRMTKAQINAMNHVAFNGYATSVIPTKKILDTLVDAKLIIEIKRTLAGRFPVEVVDYHMPIDVHFMWCGYVGDKA